MVSKEDQFTVSHECSDYGKIRKDKGGHVICHKRLWITVNGAWLAAYYCVNWLIGESN